MPVAPPRWHLGGLPRVEKPENVGRTSL